MRHLATGPMCNNLRPLARPVTRTSLHLPIADFIPALPNGPDILAHLFEEDQAESLRKCKTAERRQKHISRGSGGLQRAINDEFHRLQIPHLNRVDCHL